MTHAHILTLKRPHEAFNIPIPVGRKIENLGRGTWIVALIVITVLCAGVYVYQVNKAAEKGYAMRELEIKKQQLQETVVVLESKSAEMQSIKALQERVRALGYVPVEQLEFVDVAKHAYALAK